MKLLIIESSGKIASLKKYLPSDFEIVATGGHFKYLTKLTEEQIKNHNPVYKNNWEIPNPNTFQLNQRNNIEKMKNLALQAKEIFIATDPDREGEAIAFNILQTLDPKLHRKTKRVTFNEITKQEVLNKINNPQAFNQGLYQAQQARQIIDQLIGFKLSTIAKNYFNNKFQVSVGRVQSCVLELLKQNDNNIKQKDDINVPKQYQLKDPVLGFHTKQVFNINNAKEFKSFSIPKNKKYVVSKIHEQATYQTPLTTNDFYKIFVQKYPQIPLTMVASKLQELYNEGAITYPRTDSRKISKNWIMDNKNTIIKITKTKITDETIKRLTGNESKSINTQGAHEALRVTDFKTPFSCLKAKQGEFDLKAEIYSMIKQASINYFMPKLKVECELTPKNKKDGEKLFFTPKTISQAYFGDYAIGKEFDVHLELKPTPEPEPLPKEKIIGLLEHYGIGRPATIANMVEVNNTRNYTKIDNNNNVVLTKTGSMINNFANKNFANLINLQYTANLENLLDRIACQQTDYWKVIDDVNDEIKNINQNVNIQQEPEMFQKIANISFKN